MYASSPTWKDDWISDKDLEVVLTQLADTITSSPKGSNKVSLNSGLHFTGGEPFLNFDLLRKAISIADELKIPSIFVETNCYWCINDKTVEEKLRILQDSGLDGILVSVNPFILEQIPYERTERAVRISEAVFNDNLMIYQQFFYHQFKRLCLKNTLSLNNFFKKSDYQSLDHVELIPK
jgi:hypothetical protein